MITNEEGLEIVRLANIMAMKRVRKFAADNGISNPKETPELTRKQVQEAAQALLSYVQNLTEEGRMLNERRAECKAKANRDRTEGPEAQHGPDDQV
jgi:hypothetical protein